MTQISDMLVEHRALLPGTVLGDTRQNQPTNAGDDENDENERQPDCGSHLLLLLRVEGHVTV